MIEVPDKVKVAIADNHVAVEGPKGKLEMDMPGRTSVSQEGNMLTVARDGDDREARAMHGLGRSLLNNMVVGVSEGYVKKLEINGVGFKALVNGNTVTMNLGYSHPIKYDFARPGESNRGQGHQRHHRGARQAEGWLGGCRFARVLPRGSRTRARA